MRRIKAIIVDDEVLGRSRVRKLLQTYEHVQLIGEGANGHEALNLIKDYKPDLAFLDVEMPDRDGFQVLANLPTDERPFIIFVTAHSQFALKAFDVQATDYLLKPFDDQRFDKAIKYASDQIEKKHQSALNDQLIQLMDSYRGQSQSNPFVITFKHKGRDRSINLYDVFYIEADGNYLKIQLEKERFLLRTTMQQIMDQLDISCFLRIHRSVIVNINYMKMKSYRGNNEYLVRMRNGTEFISGRSHKESIDQFFDLIGK